MRAAPVFFRRGFVLPLVLLVIVIVSLLAITRLYISRQHMVMVAHLADKERAYYLSTAGLQAGRQVLEEVFSFLNDSAPETYPKKDKAPAAIADIIDELLDDDGFPRQDGAKLELEPALLETFLDAVDDQDIQHLDVSVVLYGARPFFVDGAQTDKGYQTYMKIDPREAAFTIAVTAHARYRESPCTTCLFTEMKLVNITPPVVGKFSFMVTERGPLQVNSIRDSRKLEGMHGAPLIISSGATCAFDETMTDADVRDLIDEQGWIYLGGDQPWEFNLSKGGGRPEYQDPLLKTYKCFHGIPGPHGLSGENQGYDEDAGDEPPFRYYSFQTGLYRELRQMVTGRPLGLLGEPEAGYSSVVNLAGSEDTPTPTMVLGKVIRKWACVQGLFNNFTDKKAVFPWLDEGTFYSNAWPGNWKANTIDTIRDSFPDGYNGENGYESRMSFICSQAYNHGNLELLEYETPELENALVQEPASFPPGTGKPPVMKRIKVDEQDQPLHALAWGSMYTLLDSGGAILYKGGSPGTVDLEKYLGPKQSYRFKSSAGLFEFFKRRTDSTAELRLNGIVNVAGDLNFNRRMKVVPGGGGIILVDGDIEVRKPIKAPPGDPLVLVSLTGNILVTARGSIDCALVALDGTVRLPENFRVNGLVAARRITFPRGNNQSKRAIVYNPGLDPTNLETYRRNYRLMVKEEWNQIVK